MLKKIRAKPDHIKQRVAFAMTLFIFCGILLVWITSLDARSRDQEVRSKTVSPINGVTSMFEGFVSGVKEQMLSKQSASKTNDSATTATSTDNFDLSSVVVIDPLASPVRGREGSQRAPTSNGASTTKAKY